MKRLHTASNERRVCSRASGTLYLYKQLREMSNPEIACDCAEDDVSQWTISIGMGLLPHTMHCYLKRWAKMAQQAPTIVLSVRFPNDYPNGVPFVRVVRPRFRYRTGHVTIGGSICTPLFTPDGWQPMNIESLVLTVVQTLIEGGALFQLAPDQHHPAPFADYSEREARDAFVRVAEQHGWKV